ncbi:MAG: response regulator [Chloroflexi bacterium HGW-Chloroflexi-9]|nr:MAG: response regulator [Chloroflexi bacterium HGW-Chloroflexi-9]
MADPRPLILVVEDDERSRKLLGEVLRDEGYIVVDAASGEMALREIRRPMARFDLVLLDINLPGLSGHHVAREIRNDALHGKIPILAITAVTQPDAVVEILEAGCNAYLGKPTQMKEVREMVALLLQEE